jgi:hypothetical protein
LRQRRKAFGKQGFDEVYKMQGPASRMQALPAEQSPRRQKAAQKVKMCVIAKFVFCSGLDFRQARRVVRAVRDRWKAALIQGESVETPLGRLSTQKMPSGRSRFILEVSPNLHFEVEMNRSE